MHSAFSLHDFCELQVRCITHSKTQWIESSNRWHFTRHVISERMYRTVMHLGKIKFRHILHLQVSTAFPPEKVGQARCTSSSMHACLSNFYSDSWDYPSFAPYAMRAENKRSVSSVLLVALKLRRLKQKRTESSPGSAKNNLTPRRINSHASLQINRSTCEAIIFPLFLTTPVQFLSTFVSSKLGANDIVFKIYIKCALNNYAASECSQQITRYE